MERMKSIRQIANQENRLYAMTQPGTERRKRIDAISGRYYANIEATEEWKQAYQNAYDFRYCDITETHLRHEIRDTQARTAGYGSADSIKFPRSVYAAK